MKNPQVSWPRLEFLEVLEYDVALEGRRMEAGLETEGGRCLPQLSSRGPRRMHGQLPPPRSLSWCQCRAAGMTENDESRKIRKLLPRC